MCGVSWISKEGGHRTLGPGVTNIHEKMKCSRKRTGAYKKKLHHTLSQLEGGHNRGNNPNRLRSSKVSRVFDCEALGRREERRFIVEDAKESRRQRKAKGEGKVRLALFGESRLRAVCEGDSAQGERHGEEVLSRGKKKKL